MILNKIYKYNNEWVSIAMTFLKNKEDAEDLIQDVYIKIHNKIQKGQIIPSKILYKNDINKYYIRRVISTTCIDFIRKKKPYTDIEQINIQTHDDLSVKENADNIIFENILNEVKNWDSKQKYLFELYMYSGLSMMKLSKIVGVSKSSVFNSLKKSKNRIKELFGEDMEDYFNNDYELIQSK